MKKVYIPKGETVTYDELNTGVIVVKGTLKVKGKLTASFVQGGGRVEAEEIQCDTMEVGIVQAEIATARKIVGKKLFIRDCIATDAIMATDFIESLHVLTKSLYISLSSISQCEAEEIIMLSQKKRGLLRMLFASKMRSVYLTIFHSKVKSVKIQENFQADEEVEKLPQEEIQQNIVENNPHMVEAIMQYLDENGYIKARPNMHSQPDINVEYEGDAA